MVPPQLRQTGNPVVLQLARRSVGIPCLSSSTTGALSNSQIAPLGRRNYTFPQYNIEVQFRTGTHPEVSYRTRRMNHIARRNNINRKRRLSKWVEDFIEAPPTIGTRSCSSWNRRARKDNDPDRHPQAEDKERPDSWQQDWTNAEKQLQEKIDALKKKIDATTRLPEDVFEFVFPTAKYATPLWRCLPNFRYQSSSESHGKVGAIDHSSSLEARDEKIWENPQHRTNYIRSFVGLPPNPIKVSSQKSEEVGKKLEEQKREDKQMKDKNTNGDAQNSTKPTSQGYAWSLTVETTRNTTRPNQPDSISKDEAQTPSSNASGDPEPKVKIKYEYDPITNRMVPKPELPSVKVLHSENPESLEINKESLKGVEQSRIKQDQSEASDVLQAQPEKSADSELDSNQPNFPKKESTPVDRLLTCQQQVIPDTLDHFVKKWEPYVDKAIQQKATSLHGMRERGHIQMDLSHLHRNMQDTHGATPTIDQLVGVLSDTGFFDAHPKHFRQGLTELKIFFENVKENQSALKSIERVETVPKQDVEMLLPEDVRATMGKKTQRNKHEESSKTLSPRKEPSRVEDVSDSGSIPRASSSPLGPIWRRDGGLPRVQLEAPLEPSISRLAGARKEQTKRNNPNSQPEEADHPTRSLEQQDLLVSPKTPSLVKKASLKRTTILEKLRSHEQARQRARSERSSPNSSFKGTMADNGANTAINPTVSKDAATRKLSEEVEATKAAMQAHEHAYHAREPKDRGQSGLARERGELCMQQGEGDMCADVVRFAGNGRWYKKLAPHALAKEVDKFAQKESDRALARQIRNIYESHYGTIDAQHRQQPLSPSSSTLPVTQTPNISVIQTSDAREPRYSLKETDQSFEQLPTTEGQLSETQSSICHPNEAAPSCAADTPEPSNSYNVGDARHIGNIKNLFGTRLLQIQNEIVHKMQRQNVSTFQPLSEQEIEILILQPYDKERLYNRQQELIELRYSQEAHLHKAFSDEELDVINAVIPDPPSDSENGPPKFSIDQPHASTGATTSLNDPEISPGQQEPSPTATTLDHTNSHGPLISPEFAPEYKIVYNNDRSTTDTETIISPLPLDAHNTERPLSLCTILASLDSPRIFIPCIHLYLVDGFEPIRATKSMVILRRLVPTSTSSSRLSPLDQGVTAEFKMMHCDSWTSKEDVTTPINFYSIFAPTDTKPLPLSTTLATLDYPERYLTDLRRYIGIGFEPIDIFLRSMVILRRFTSTASSSSPSSSSTASPSTTTAKDPVGHSTSPTVNPIDGTTTTTQPITAMETKDQHDLPPSPSINPIDGTTAPLSSPAASGNFASPTGFVNFGEETEEAAAEAAGVAAGRRGSKVRREERVFSGGRRERRHTKWNGRGRRKRVVFWTALVTAGGCYLIGVLSELLR